MRAAFLNGLREEIRAEVRLHTATTMEDITSWALRAEEKEIVWERRNYGVGCNRLRSNGNGAGRIPRPTMTNLFVNQLNSNVGEGNMGLSRRNGPNCNPSESSNVGSNSRNGNPIQNLLGHNTKMGGTTGNDGEGNTDEGGNGDRRTTRFWSLDEIAERRRRNLNISFWCDALGYISLGCDILFVLRGRSPIQAYADFKRDFRGTFRPSLGVIITGVQIGMGPGGVLRCLSFSSRKPNLALLHELCEFQCYDKYMLVSINAFARNIGKREWGDGGPFGIRSLMQHPEHPFFLRNGKFFLEWYSGISACSLPFQVAVHILVSCVTWSLDGCLVGVSFTKHFIPLYTYNESNELVQCIEIDAYIGGRE